MEEIYELIRSIVMYFEHNSEDDFDILDKYLKPWLK